MTNRQSNIIFYSVISVIIYVVIVNNFYPEFFEDFSKSKQELAIKEAVSKGEHNQALVIYQQLVDESIGSGSENSPETANLYQEMAKLYALLGNKAEEKNHYLKSLNVQQQLKDPKVFNFATTYTKLGALAEAEQQYDQAQAYYEQSLSKMLGDSQEKSAGDDGLFVGLQSAQEGYTRLNNEWTIAAIKRLGNIHYLKKEYAPAKKYYERALMASQLTFGEDDAKTLELKGLMTRLAL